MSMRKTMMTGLALALSLAGVAGAQQPGQDSARPRDKGARAEMGRRGGPDGLLLKGVTLTEGQRTQIAQLRKTEKQAMQARRETAKKELEAVRQARQRGDTAAVRVAMEKRFQVMQQEREQRVAAIRSLLTAEQHVQFDKNVAELKQRQADRVAKFGERGKAKRGPGARGPRGERGPGR
jgi:Spy/CpxP family protein refolding chaperone